jgi:hypothetical protein
MFLVSSLTVMSNAVFVSLLVGWGLLLTSRVSAALPGRLRIILPMGSDDG